MMLKKEVITRLFVDVSAAFIGVVVGVLCLHMFRNGALFPLKSFDGLILISTTFIALLLSSVLSKVKS